MPLCSWPHSSASNTDCVIQQRAVANTRSRERAACKAMRVWQSLASIAISKQTPGYATRTIRSCRWERREEECGAGRPDALA